MADTIDTFAPPGPPFDPDGVLHLSRRLDGLAGAWHAAFGHRQRSAETALSSWTGPLADEFGRRIGIEAGRSRDLVAALRAEAGAWSRLALHGAGTGSPRAMSWAGAGSTRADVPGGAGIGAISGSRSDGTESRADTATLDLFLAAGAELRHDLDPDLVSVGRLDDQIRAETGALAVPGGAVHEGRRLLWALEDHEHEVLDVSRRLVAADQAGASPTVVGLSPGGGPGIGGLLASPWLAPSTDSRVVNLSRALSGTPPPPGFLRGLAGDGRALAAELVGAMVELGPTNQQRLALTDPGRFLDNWGRAGQGALATVGGLLLAGAGAVALVHPNGDQGWEALTGRRPGRELLDGLAAAVGLALSDPDALARSQIGWEQLESDPYRWFGAMAPELALEILGPGLVARPRPGLVVGPKPATGPAVVDDLIPVVAASVDPGPTPSHRPPNLAQFRRAETEWEPAGPIVSHRARPLEAPEGWVADLNGEGRHLPGRDVNCIDCARAVESNWRGQDAVAAPLRGPGRGTSAQRLEQWSGAPLTATSLDGVRARLDQLGPGSSAMIVSDWKGGSAHAYNAVNDRGTVKWVDAQLGEVSRWPPRYADRVKGVYAIFVDPRGLPVRNLD